MDQGFDTTDCDRTDTRGLLQELERLRNENEALRHEIQTLRTGLAHTCPHRGRIHGVR